MTKTHSGMLQAAQHINGELHNKDILSACFRECPDYKLIVVGHSLGAGVASLLACLLRSSYQTLECFPYSPPGAMLPADAADYVSTFTTSVVVGSDVVPRLSYGTLMTLRSEVLWALGQYRDPKYQVFLVGPLSKHRRRELLLMF
eukprot:m.83273 g.83273  ORF g.83273 m.83273 type:complete len:145 (+) comp8295_c0_seq4:177-611(+)